MKSITARQISKNWNEVLLRHAETEVPITNRGEVVAYLRVPPRKKGQKVKMPDFRSRIRACFGNRTLTEADIRVLDESMKRSVLTDGSLRRRQLRSQTLPSRSAGAPKPVGLRPCFGKRDKRLGVRALCAAFRQRPSLPITPIFDSRYAYGVVSDFPGANAFIICMPAFCIACWLFRYFWNESSWSGVRMFCAWPRNR